MRNPGAAQRASVLLRAAPERGNQSIAAQARCSPWTVCAQRRVLERLGQIPCRAVRPGLRPGQQLPSRTRDAIEAGAATPRAVADAAGTSIQAGWKALKLASSTPPLPGRACGPLVLPGHAPFPVGWPRESDAAVRICRNYCPVLTRCRIWAMTQPDTPGILAGLTQRERQQAHTGSNG